MSFDEWKDNYGLMYEPNYSEATEADCKAAFAAGAASRDAEIAELVAALRAVIPEVAGGNAGLIAYNKCKAALAKGEK